MALWLTKRRRSPDSARPLPETGYIKSLPEDAGGRSIALGQRVGVAIQGHRRLRVAMSPGDGADVDAGGDESRDGKMTQVVEAEGPTGGHIGRIPGLWSVLVVLRRELGAKRRARG